MKNIHLELNAEIWTATDESGEVLKTEVSYDAIEAWARRKKHNILSVTGLDED